LNPRFRDSEYIDFNTGSVKVAPLQLQFKMSLAGSPDFSDLVRLFECRTEVWHLGVATQMLKQIEFYSPPSIWSHSAYGLLTLLITYFETIGKILNADATAASTTADDFIWGFRDVYPDLTTTSGKPYDPQEFYRRSRNGLAALGSSQSGLWVHNERTISLKDFDIVQKNPNDPSTLRYYINPHTTTRTVIDHFPTFIARLNDPSSHNDALRQRFRAFVGGLGDG
jgi:hypothetical protein